MAGGEDWLVLAEAFMEHLADAEKSAATRRSYRETLREFARWYEDHAGRPAEPGELVKRDLIDWKADLMAAGGRKAIGQATATVNRKLSAIRSFCRFLASIDKGVRFEPPRPARRQDDADARWLTPQEERGLLAAAERAGRRELAAVYLGLHGGLRCEEMAGLRWEDITIGARRRAMMVRGKGAKLREVHLSERLRDALAEYGGRAPRGEVLVGRRGPLSYRGIQDLVVRLGARARVGRTVGIKDFSHHCLRHTCARRMIDRGVPIADVARHLGHSDVKTTMRYMRARDEDLARAAAALDEGG